MAIVNYISVDFEVSPRIIWIDTTSSTSISVQDLIDTASQKSALPANMDDDILLTSSGKEFLVGDGSVQVGLTVTLNNAKIAFRSLGGPAWILCSIEGGNVVAVEDLRAETRVYTDVVHPTPYITVERVSSSSATLIEQEAIQYGSYGGGVSIDVINGAAGTAYPIGNQEFPVNNLADAVTIANTKGFHILFILNSMTFGGGQDVSNFTLHGISHVNTMVTIEPSLICVNLNVEHCNVNGTLDGGTHIDECYVGDLAFLNGHIHKSGLYGTITLDGNVSAVMDNCYTGDQDNPPVVDMGGSGQDLAMPNYAGLVTVMNLDSTSEEIGIGINAGMVTLADTITAGTIIIAGVGVLIDNSTGTASVNSVALVNNAAIADAVWDEDLSEHPDPDTTGESLDKIDKNTTLIPGTL